jgi:hypothetical protein
MSLKIAGPLSVDGRDYELEEPRAAGFKGVVWRGRDRFGEAVAIKLAIHEDYLERSYLDEVKAVHKLQGSSAFTTFKDAGPVQFRFPDGSERRFIAFVEKWVDGPTLRERASAHAPRA